MKRSRLTIWAVLSLAMIAVGFDFAAKAHLKNLAASAEAQVARYGLIGQSLTRARQIAAKNQVDVALDQALAAEKARLARAARTKAPPAEANVDPLRVIALNPSLRSQYLQLIRDGLAADWNLLFRALNLSPADAEKLQDLLTQKIANRLTVDQTAADLGLDPDDRAMKKMFTKLDHQNRNDLTALLGPDGYATYVEYYKEHAAAPVVVDFTGNLPTAEQLSFTQAARLSQVLSNASQKSQWGYAVYGTIDVDQAVAAATPILSPEQLTALRALLQKNAADLQIKKLSGQQ